MAILKIKIDCSKIDKSKLFPGKNGAKYLDATILLKDNGEVDAYGNCGMIVQDISKEEREAGAKGNILGNAKEMGEKKKPVFPNNKPATATVDAEEDDLPF